MVYYLLRGYKPLPPLPHPAAETSLVFDSVLYKIPERFKLGGSINDTRGPFVLDVVRDMNAFEMHALKGVKYWGPEHLHRANPRLSESIDDLQAAFVRTSTFGEVFP